MTESWSGVAPSSRRRIRPMNGVVTLAKTANRSAAETSMRSARRISGLKGGGLISTSLCRILGGVTTHPSAPPDLTGQVALVTGAGRGIGQAIALALAAVGADVAAVDLESPLETRARVEALTRRCLAIPADVADRAAVETTVARTLAELGRLDVVVNNAGIGERLALEDLDDATLQRVVDVILKGTILVSQAAYPHLKARGGAIVNIASVSGMAGGAPSRPAPPGATADRPPARTAAAPAQEGA